MIEPHLKREEKPTYDGSPRENHKIGSLFEYPLFGIELALVMSGPDPWGRYTVFHFARDMERFLYHNEIKLL